ncbi:MAG: PD-(D/E)XK nuclease family transposase [Prevotella sp.]|nr:PD-(D/E)XK nuclease family transposase [Prevotella sp.]
MAPDNRERYINPYTDFGFKKLFGTEMNKDLLISFLNALFMGHQNIKDVKYLPTEHFGVYGDSRRAIFDVYCEDENGGKFIVEMQNVYQQFFKDRSVFYSTFPIQEQAKVGAEWDFNLKEVYTVGILNFEFRDDEYSKDCYHHKVKLMDTATKKVFFDKLTYIYLEMPKFNKTEDELETMFDKWLFVLRNLSRLFERPKALQERVFTKLFEQAEIARFSPEERRGYEDSVKAYRDINNAINTAKAEAKAEGLAEGEAIGAQKTARENARKMKSDGMSAELITKYTGLSAEEINML